MDVNGKGREEEEIEEKGLWWRRMKQKMAEVKRVQGRAEPKIEREATG
jgi:hypothetical protein